MTDAVRAHLESALIFYEGTTRYLSYLANEAKKISTDIDKKIKTQIAAVIATGASNDVKLPNELRRYLIYYRDNSANPVNANPVLRAEFDSLLQQPSGSLISPGVLFTWLQAEGAFLTQKSNQADADIVQSDTAFIAPFNPASQVFQRAPTEKILKKLMGLIAKSHGNAFSFPAGDISWLILNEISKNDGNPQLQNDLRLLINKGVVTQVVSNHFLNLLMAIGTGKDNLDYQIILQDENNLGIEENIYSQLSILLSGSKPNVSLLGLDLAKRLNELLQLDLSSPPNAQWNQAFKKEVADLLKTLPVLATGGPLDTYLQQMQQDFYTKNMAERTRIDNLQQQFTV